MDGLDLTSLARLGLALVFTLSLIGLLALLLRRYGQGMLGAPGKGNSQRLAVTEWRLLDARHRLVLIRRDQQEHLLLLTQNAAPLLIESGITKPETPAPAAPPSPAAPIGPAR